MTNNISLYLKLIQIDKSANNGAFQEYIPKCMEFKSKVNPIKSYITDLKEKTLAQYGGNIALNLATSKVIPNSTISSQLRDMEKSRSIFPRKNDKKHNFRVCELEELLGVNLEPLKTNGTLIAGISQLTKGILPTKYSSPTKQTQYLDLELTD